MLSAINRNSVRLQSEQVSAIIGIRKQKEGATAVGDHLAEGDASDAKLRKSRSAYFPTEAKRPGKQNLRYGG